jgi:hypothetical protein
MATVTIVGIHYWHRADIVLDGPAVRPVPDGQGIASPPVPASESGAAITPVVPVVMESVGAATRAVASEPVPATSANAAIAAVEEPVPAALQDDAAVSSPAPPARTEAKPRASAPRRGATAAPDKRAIAHERPTPKRHAAPATMPPAPRGTGAARVRSRVAHAVKKRHPDRWHVMYASLASCGGDLIDRIVCDQRVRLRFCNGYWGEVPQCGGDGAREQGQ